MSGQKKDTRPDWAKFLNPESLKENLIAASLFLAAWETLRSSIIDQIRGFFTNGFDESGLLVDEEYQLKVLALDKSPIRASLLWLKGLDVISDADIEAVDEIREHRNELAHDLPKFITTAEAEINKQLLGRILELITKIDRWWIIEVEIPTNSDFDSTDVDFDGIVSGRTLFLQMMFNIATGDDSSAYWEMFRKNSGEPN